ncbi:Proline dehydrogenase 1, mitochondrial [Plecturocebus cupreus]
MGLIQAFSLLTESITKMGIVSRAEIEDWFMAETLGVSGTGRPTMGFSLEATTGLELGSHGTLQRCLDYMLEELKYNAKAKVMVATHHENSVHFTLHR